MAPKNYGAQAVLLEKKLLAIAQGTCFVTERQALSYQSYPYNKVVIPNGVPSSWIGAPVEPVFPVGRELQRLDSSARYIVGLMWG